MDIYANIIVDISHEKLDKTFQYLVPTDMLGKLRIGMRVQVPFGSRTMKGYVIELTKKPEFDVTKIKPIQEILTDEVAIESQMIALAAWMRRNYGGTMNHALKTVLPVKTKRKLKEKKKLRLLLDEKRASMQLHEYERKHNTARYRLLEALMDTKELDYEIVTGKLNVSAIVVRAFEEQHIIEIDTTTAYRNPVKQSDTMTRPLQLNEEQQLVVNGILQDFEQAVYDTYLIHGVTGSGKTEVYMELIAAAIQQKKQSIVLIPEIALTYQTVMRFYKRFGDRVSILNSKMSPGERYDQFLRAENGEIDVMIGPRSALFTPFPQLGFIIIDEEHEGTYKSETLPRYHARETAIERARMAGASVVLGSATPSLESYARAMSGEYQFYHLEKRVQERPLPEVEVIDLREELRAGNRSILSEKLQQYIADRLEKKEQTMLFINRRGVAGFVSCRACGHVIKCPHCDVSLSQHSNGTLVCHYCGYTQPMVSKCPECGSKYIGGFKAGTQKIEQVVAQMFPQARILRMDADTTKNKDGYEKILSAFSNGEADILIGTQMIVKGHDFPNVTLVGVLAADLSLHVSDYRAAERTFQLLTQAAGRAGRGEKPGNVIVQTYQPEHYSIQTAKDQDYVGFYEQEMVYREMMEYPPVSNLLLIMIASKREERAAQMAELLKKQAGRYGQEEASPTVDMCGNEQEQSDAAVLETKLRIIGPADASIAKVNDIYKKVLYLKHFDYNTLVNVKDDLENYMEKQLKMSDVSVQFDFNPMSGF